MSQAPLLGRFLQETRHVVATLRVLVLAGLVLLGMGSTPKDPGLFWFVTCVYGFTNFGYLWANNREYDLRRIKWMIFLFDVLVVGMLIVLRGEHVQHFLTAYFTLVLIAAMVDGLGNAVFNAGFVSLLYLTLTRNQFDWSEMLQMETLGQCVFFFVVSLFMAHVATGARNEKQGRKRAEADRDRVEVALEHASSELRQSTADLRAAREALRANDHLFTLGMLSAGIAHEMKNPIAAILASVREAPDMLEELREAIQRGEASGPLLEELGDVVADCDQACSQLQRVARDLGDMVRGGQSEVRNLDPAESISGAARMLRKAVGTSIHLDVDCRTSREVQADPGRLMQVLLNLAKNGIDAMRDRGGGTLRLVAEDGASGRVTFRVQDTGPGIPDEVRAHMYDPFFTTKGPGEGTGLGLHLVNEIVKSQKGVIECESVAGEGTTFHIHLPGRDVAPAEETSDAESPANPADRGRRGDDPQGTRAHAA